MTRRDDFFLKTGAVINGKWVILEFLGKGGMGEVYKAHQLDLGRYVAIKLISGSWIRSFEGDSDAVNSSIERFRREVRIRAQITHPNVAQIYDYGTLAAEADREAADFAVMEYVPGGSLRSSIPDEGFYPDENRARDWIASFFLPLLEGVEALHAAGIIHRDLKAENVLLDNDTPKIVDFGLAGSFHLGSLTRSAKTHGAPLYMSPEYFMDVTRADERTDIYASGKILYEAMSGNGSDRLPFGQAGLPSPQSKFFQKLHNVINLATAENRDERFPSVELFIAALESAIGKENKTVSPPIASVAGRWFRLSPLPIGLLLLIMTASAAGAFMYTKGYGRQLSPDLHYSSQIPKAMSNRSVKVARLEDSGKTAAGMGFEGNTGPSRQEVALLKSTEPGQTKLSLSAPKTRAVKTFRPRERRVVIRASKSRRKSISRKNRTARARQARRRNIIAGKALTTRGYRSEIARNRNFPGRFRAAANPWLLSGRRLLKGFSGWFPQPFRTGRATGNGGGGC